MTVPRGRARSLRRQCGRYSISDMGTFIARDGEVLLFVGDSITDCGRRGSEAPWGNGYARMVAETSIARHPERQIRVINKGIGGNRITDLQNRWADDVLYHKPHVLVVMIGINDLHAHLRGGEGGVDPDLFARTFDALLELTLKRLSCQILLLAPFYISRDHRGGSFRSTVLEIIPRYVDVVRRMSEKYGTRYVDLHALFQRHLEHREADAFCPEPVHPNHGGHLVIAGSVMDALER